jgi:tetratricopeptide (TPR) repeat protein
LIRLGEKAMREAFETNRNQTNQTPFRGQKVSMSPEEFMAIGEIGAMFYEQGNLDKAQTIFEGLVEIDPQSDAAHAALGALLTKRRDDENALVHLNKALELNSNEIAPFVNRAEVYLRRQRFEAAVVDLKCAIELDPQEKDAGANRARAMVLGIYQAIESQKAEQKAQQQQ